MPIRINLLAEAQAAEEVRRKDPVKRATWVAIVLVSAVACWTFVLWTRTFADNSRLSTLMGKLNSRTNQYTQVLGDKQHLLDVETKLTALNRFASNRFLQANLLDALQRGTVTNIHVIKLQTVQTFDVIPESKPSVTESGVRVPGRLGRSTERTRLIIDARDTSEVPGGEYINKFKDTLAQYFKGQQISTNAIRLINLQTPQIEAETGKPYVQFNLDIAYPERSR